MITFRITAQVSDDRTVTLILPPEVPTGTADLVITVATDVATQPKRLRRSLADWAEEHSESWADRLSSQDVETFTGRSF